MARALVTVELRMYREAIALAVQRGLVETFLPHVLVRNDSHAAVPERLLRSVVVRVEVLIRDGMAVRVVTGDESYGVEDAGIGALLALVGEAKGLLSRGPVS